MAKVDVTREDVMAAADLAKIELSESDVAELTPQIARVVAFFDQLDSLDTSEVEPLAHVGDLSNVLAEDEEGESLSRRDALANAPKSDDTFFRVPPVLGGD